MLEKIGAGGMGEVYLAHDTRLDRRVALKVLTGADRAGEMRERLHREAKAAARLNHPGIAAVHDVLDEGDRCFIVMEYVEGRSLDAMSDTRLPVAQAVDIAVQLADALAYAHDRGVVHRDVKPANVRVRADGSAKLLDLGIARVTVEGTLGGAHTTATSLVKGTPAYMAPEQLAGGNADARADVYSLGALLFEVLAGRRPFVARNFLDQALAVNSGRAPLVGSLNPAVPADVEAAVARALERDPADRFQTAAAFAAALRAASTQLAGSATSVVVRGDVRSPRAPLLAAAAAIVALAAIVPAYRLADATPPAAPRRTALAMLPIVNVPGDSAAESLAAGIAAVLVNNLATAPGLTLLSGSATAPHRARRNEIPAIARELEAVVVDLTLERRGDNAATVRAAVFRPGADAPAWSETIEGDVLTVEQRLIESIARSLETTGAFGRRLTPDEWARLRRMPTTSSEAMAEYATARTMLDHWERPGNPDRAAALFSSATKRDPAFALAYAGLADARALRPGARREPATVAAAIEAAEAAVRLDPAHAAVRTALGSIKRLTGQADQAIAEFRKALATQPNNNDARRLLGQTLAEQGHVDDGVAEIGRAIDIRPDYWNNYFTLGYVLYEAGRYKEAANAYRRTTELNPDYPGGYQMLGTAHHRLGDIDAAIGNYQRAVRLGPSAPAYSNLGFFYFSARRYREAVAAYSEAVTRDPAAPQYHRNLADAHRRAGDAADARAEYERAIVAANAALAINPRDALTIALVALCEARLGRASAAERHAAEAAAQPAASRDVFARQAQVLALIGQPKRALAALHKAVQAGYVPSADDDEFATLRDTTEFKALIKAPPR